MTPNRHGSAVVELPNDLDVLTTRKFDAPIQLVFDVLTKPEHMNKWFAPQGCVMKECSIDLSVGGEYHQVFVTDDGKECSFRGTYLEIDAPTRTVETWVFDGTPHLDAVETLELHEADGVTTMTLRMTYRDKASRDEQIQGGSDGQQSSLDNMEDLLRSLLDRRAAVLEFPSDLEIVLTRDFDAPIQLVFDVFTKPEHVRKTFAPFGETVTVCSIDLRVGGSYHIVMVTDDGTECSFRGTYLEVEPPARTVATWLFEGWPDAEAVESMNLQETDGVTTLTHRLAFRDQAGRDHMTKFDGFTASFDHVDHYLRSLLNPTGGAAALPG